jgi:hypothetical protein
MDEPSPGCDPPGALSLLDRVLHGDILGHSIDSGLGESSSASWLEAKGVEEVGESSMLTGPHRFQHGFLISKTRGLVHLWDLPPSTTFLV